MHGVFHRLAKAAAPLCAEPSPLAGLLLHHLAEYEARDRPLLVQRYGLDRGPGVLSVLAGSPAAAAGLRAGDLLLAVNGSAFPSPALAAAEPDEDRRRSAVEASEALLFEALKSGPAKLRLVREGAETEIELASTAGCGGLVRLATSRQLNAFATGRYVVMTSALLRFLRSDDELAVALAHELAHNILAHPDRLKAQKVPRGILRGIGKNASRVRATEEEADRLAIRLMWAAGYDVGAALPFWRRLYRYDLPQIWRTHPSLPARERLIAQAIAELPASRSKQIVLPPRL